MSSMTSKIIPHENMPIRIEGGIEELLQIFTYLNYNTIVTANPSLSTANFLSFY